MAVVRAMILAAGLGTRLRPLTDLRAKPALPVRGRPVISLLLEFLARQGCREVMINLHHRSESVRAAVETDHPAELEISWSEESVALGTGGGIRRAANFLRKSESCVVLAGDMLLDVPLKELFDRHVASRRHVTLVLRDDARAERFGSIGTNRDGFVTRIGTRAVTRDPAFELESGEAEVASGLFTGVRFFQAESLTDWPTRDRVSDEDAGSDKDDKEETKETVFEDLRDWLVPGIEVRGLAVGAEILDTRRSVWEPVGTPAEYLQANLTPPDLPTLGGAVENWTGDVEVRGANHDVIVSKRAHVGEDTELERCVIWDGETVPAGFRGQSGVYAGGDFRSCLAATTDATS